MNDGPPADVNVNGNDQRSLLEERISQIAYRLAQGRSYDDVRRWVVEAWDLSIPCASRYLREAQRQLRYAANQSLGQQLERHLKLLSGLATEAKEAGQLAIALKCYQESARLLGLYKSDGEKNQPISIEDLYNEVRA